MIELEHGDTLEVNLSEDAQGRERIRVALQTRDCHLELSPHQARVLATELIMAVNRAEVRNNLKRSHNLVRGEAQPEAKRRLFHQAFAK
jgi:hypothetical protein